MTPYSILYVEDDLNLSYVTKDNLEMKGYSIKHFVNGKEAWEAFKTQHFDLCILDVMLPIMDGFTLAQKIRTINNEVPILFLTAKSLTEDKITGLQLGADDYILKPYSIVELQLKIAVFLKRSKKPDSQALTKTHLLSLSKTILSVKNLTLTCNSQTINLTQKELDLLLFLFNNANQIIARERLLQEVWGKDDYFLGRSMDVFITRIRKYLALDPELKIETVHGVGFRFNAPN